MLELLSEFYVRGLTAATAINFMISCSNEDYQKWWPGTEILWRVDQGETIQAWMTLEGVDDENGVTLSHLFKAISTGTNGILDPSFKNKFTPKMRSDFMITL